MYLLSTWYNEKCLRYLRRCFFFVCFCFLKCRVQIGFFDQSCHYIGNSGGLRAVHIQIHVHIFCMPALGARVKKNHKYAVCIKVNLV